MRISDWSSDVCSSDLRHADFPLQRPNQIQNLRLDGDVQRGGGLVHDHQRRTAAQCYGDDHALPHAARKMVRMLQLGRASCRERVCQYGEISVGAVSLKKKKNNTKTQNK